MVITVFAWGVAVGYVVAKIVDMIQEIRSARREAKRKIAEAREHVNGDRRRVR